MDIRYLPLDLGEQPLNITVGIQAETSAVERVAEPFRERLHVVRNTDSCSTVGCEVVFRQSENRQEIEVLLPLGDDRSGEHRILVSVADSPFPALDSVAYAVLAPAFVPGGVGVDWDDVCLILRSGTRAVLVMAESGDALSVALGLAESALATGDRTRISGVIAAVFAPHGATWLEAVRQLGRATEALAPDAWRLVAAPKILGDTPVCAVLALLPK